MLKNVAWKKLIVHLSHHLDPVVCHVLENLNQTLLFVIFYLLFLLLEILPEAVAASTFLLFAVLAL